VVFWWGEAPELRQKVHGAADVLMPSRSASNATRRAVVCRWVRLGGCIGLAVLHLSQKFNPPLKLQRGSGASPHQKFCGTELNITQEGVPAAIPPEACYLGWQESLTLLAQLVEPEIPDTH